MITLVPNTGIQFVDVEINTASLRSVRFRQSFEAEKIILSELTLDPESGRLEDSDGREVAEEEQVNGSITNALKMLAGEWLPLPYFRNKETGPVNWARLYVPAASRREDTKMVIAFDTTLAEYQHGSDLPHYAPELMPVEKDVPAGQTVFALPSQVERLNEFLALDWVSNWLDHLAELQGIGHGDSDRERRAKFRAHLTALLLTLSRSDAMSLPPAKFIDTVSNDESRREVQVDLVLDIGNSRTFGLIVEEADPNNAISLSDSYPMVFRDISSPDLIHNRPFESRLEFHKPYFGPEYLSKASGRRIAFRWPSAVRIGHEAARLSHNSSNVEGATGMSSPKRYLWSVESVAQDWRFNTSINRDTRSSFDSGGYFENFSASGDYIGEDSEELPAMSAKFSRSSMMTFLLVELLLQVLREINAPSRRESRGEKLQARRLRRIVLTMPTAMTRPERRLLQLRLDEALAEVWRTTQALDTPKPKIQMQWDEATATQAVYVYNEVVERFYGDTEGFMHASARNHEGGGSLRIASIDIGGGTTDLIISSYRNEARGLLPKQEFREGFQCAGDDIVKGVIENHVIPALLTHLENKGVTDAQAFISDRLGSVQSDHSALRRIRKQQFCQQVLVPIALWILGQHEKYEKFEVGREVSFTWSGAFQGALRQPSDAVLEHIVGYDDGADDISLTDLAFIVPAAELNRTITRVMEPFIECLAEATYYYDCDLLLLAGRPSRFPAVRDLIVQCMPVTADRVVTMHDYEVGDWYPLRKSNFQIGDPKTCAAVGAMICALSEGQLNDFHMRTSQLTMKSTARFIGEVSQGKIKDEYVLFRDVDMERNDQAINDVTFQLHPPAALGFRQLDLDRWPATMLYSLRLNKSTLDGPIPSTIDVTLTRVPPDDDPRERLFEVETCVDGEGDYLPPTLVKMNLQTMLMSNLHWADSGCFELSGIKR